MTLGCCDSHIVHVIYIATLANWVYMMYLKFFSTPYLFVTRCIGRITVFHYRPIS